VEILWPTLFLIVKQMTVIEITLDICKRYCILLYENVFKMLVSEATDTLFYFSQHLFFSLPKVTVLLIIDQNLFSLNKHVEDDTVLNTCHSVLNTTL